ncbi:MAG: hypothetical protein RL325_1477 [Planctomycetota bacterium]|jgi:thioredoxin reductase/Pyruvate/2-oxoacid:ferredoxin oxidoreductase delta subunit
MAGESSPILITVVGAALMLLALAAAISMLIRRREEIRRSERIQRERDDAVRHGSHKARLIHPDIDLSKCIGCGACTRACPEDGVLDLLHGQAVVVHGARCVGHGRCAEACPTGAIALTFADLSTRNDLPATNDDFEAIGTPGLYLAGEVTGFSLVRNAVNHGTTVANAVDRRMRDEGAARATGGGAVDLLIVGAGPAGMGCALRAKELGLSIDVIDQSDAVGGTVAAYPRRKMVMTQPMHLPLHGKLDRLEYQKEELVTLWDRLAREHALPIRTGVRLKELRRGEDGVFTADTSAGPVRARQVCLALGRRGTPRKLGIPGEELPKVLYSLLDAESYKGRHILVVGSGDSAVEAALAVAHQEGNTVTLAARSRDLPRIKSKNSARLQQFAREGRLTLLVDYSPVRIGAGDVELARSADGATDTKVLPNDDLFVCIGGDPPFDLLRRSGVSFDPALRPAQAPVADNTTPLIWAFGALIVATLALLAWALLHRGYYGTPSAQRAVLEGHSWLRPAGAFGLGMAVVAVTLFLWNLAYLARRSARIGRLLPGSLRFWLGSHIFTGLAGFLCVILHAGFTYRTTLGGYAFLTLGIVLVAGLVGRYLYAAVPHAANGREMNLDELRARLAAIATEWDKKARGLGDTVRDRIDGLIREERWRPSILARIAGLVTAHARLRRTLHELRMDPRLETVPDAEREELMLIARQSLRLTLQIAHYEEIRALLGSWRFFHRWVALLMLLLVVAHIGIALRYARLEWPLASWWRGAPAVAAAEEAGR